MAGLPDPFACADLDGARNADRIPAPLALVAHALGHRNSQLGSTHWLRGCATAWAVPLLETHPSLPGGRWWHTHVRHGPLRSPLWARRALGSRLGRESRPGRNLRLSSEE